MRISSRVLVFLTLVLLVQSVAAPQTAPQAPLSPAPVLAIGKDAQDRPIPFGIPPYYTPDTALGTGPYKAVMATDPSLPEHVLYYPANIDAAAKLPIVSWGNGACIHAGNRFRLFLTEIASHGFLVISAGRMGHVSLEVGPQENPAVTQPGAAPAAPAAAAQASAAAANDPSAPWRSMRSNADHLKQAIDWAIAENGRAGSKFYGKLNTAKVGVGGQSCGGGLATQVAADPRVTAVGMFNSGSRLTNTQTPAPGSNANPADARNQAQARLDAIHTPILYLTGDEKRDIAYPGGHDSFGYLTKVPVIWAWEEGLAHIGTYGAPNGGAIGRIASNWYGWQLRGDNEAAKMFAGSDCILCREPTWHVQKKNIK